MFCFEAHNNENSSVSATIMPWSEAGRGFKVEMQVEVTVVVALDIGPISRWSMDEYCKECSRKYEIYCFQAKKTNDLNIKILELDRRDGDTALDAWQGRQCFVM